MNMIDTIISKLTKPQREGLLSLDDWCKYEQISSGRGCRTGRSLVKKGLAYWTGEVNNYADKYRITELGKSVANEIRNQKWYD